MRDQIPWTTSADGIVRRITRGSWHRQDYSFDAYGNLREVKTKTCTKRQSDPDPCTDGATCCAASSTETRAIGVDAATNRLSTGAVYDAAGQLISLARDGVTTTFGWYPSGELRSMQRGAGAPAWDYRYTASGERTVTRVVPAAGQEVLTVTLRGLDNEPLRVYRKANGTWLRERDYVYRGRQLLAMVTPALGVAAAHLDHLGTVRYLTDQAGVEVGYHAYFPFGEEVPEPPTTAPAVPLAQADTVRAKFTGHERDLQTTLTALADDLDYMHARYESPITGRFLTVDPVLDVKKSLVQPQRWNRYAYAIGNPIVFADPTGEQVYLITYTKGNTEGDEEFKRAALTREAELKAELAKAGTYNKTDTILVRGVTTKQDLGTVLKEAAGLQAAFGKVGSLDKYSHGGRRDGPTFQFGTDNVHWFQRSELGSLTGNWAAGAAASFFACKSGINFAQAFASAQRVTTYGFMGGVNMSARPDRMVPIQESGPVYVIGRGMNTPLMPLFGAASFNAHEMVGRDP